jgi:S1-C subfamily serine protease
LHQAPGTGEIEAEVNRNEQKTKLVLPLEKGWRRKGDMSWRTMGWHVSRLPGFQMRTRPSGNGSSLALRVNNIWPPGPGAEAGIADGDVIVEIDGLKSPMSEGVFLTYLSQKKKPGQTIDLVVLRKGERRKAMLTLKK